MYLGSMRIELEVGYPLVMTDIAIENDHKKWWIYPLKMVIFHSYVSLPEGTFEFLHLSILLGPWATQVDS